MPYISSEDRWSAGQTFSGAPVGEINYLITNIIDTWLGHNGINYTNLNSMVGVLECAKQELYRRVASPYEDEKCAKNGDVYTCLGGK